jgi:integrase
LLQVGRDALLPLEEGWRRYLEFVARPPVQGGAGPATVKRYRSVFVKFLAFAQRQGVRFWEQVTKDVLMRYGRWLEDEDYHDKTQYTELTVLKQSVKWMVEEGLLPPAAVIKLRLAKVQGSSTYCYTPAEVRAVVAHCRAREGLGWLADVVVALATTGLRIGELAGLRWGDVDLDRGLLTLTDTTRRGRKSRRHEARTTKSHRDRTLPVHPSLREVLDRLPQRADGRMFHGPRQGLLKPDTVRNVLKRDVLPALAGQFPAGEGAAGIRAGRPHGFRHYFCSMAADAGVPEQRLMSWLGHRDSAMIRLYYHDRQHEEARRQLADIPFLGGPPASHVDEGKTGTDQ